MVNEETLSDDPLPEVLNWERATGLLEEADGIAVSYCYCRHKAEHLGKRCDAPMEICLSLNGGAEFVQRRGFGRAIERGRLAHLLFDEGASRGSRFLNHVVQALNRLPASQRLLAREQVKSRFVRQALRSLGNA